jgi:hypothetical protein
MQKITPQKTKDELLKFGAMLKGLEDEVVCAIKNKLAAN